MTTASCHCGLIHLDIDGPPAEVVECNCSICRRYGAQWAFYSPGQVSIRAEAAAQTYLWGDRRLAFHRCPACGCVTHWSYVDPARDQMGVNARLMEPSVRDAARLRHLDGADTWQYLD